MLSGDLLREARRRAGLTQAELALRSGTGRSLISRYERGEVEPGLEALRRLIRACGLDLAVRLVNADAEDHDLSLIVASLAKTPAERFAAGNDAAASLNRLWGEAKVVAG
jgi:transcriptional regulator with XRE-family HTH domain